MIVRHETEPSRDIVTIKWLRTVEELGSLKAEWIALRDSDTNRTFFTDYDLMLMWYQNYCGSYDSKEKRHPLVGAAWQNGRLVGIVPLVFRSIRSRYIPIRRIDFAGFSMEGGAFLIPDARKEIAGEFIASLAAKSDFDILVLGNLEKDSLVFQTIEEGVQRLGLKEQYIEYYYALVDLSGGYEEYCRRKGKNFRRNLRRQNETMSGLGQVRIDRIKPTSPEAQDVSKFLPRMFDIGERGWRAMKAGLDVERFHQRFYMDLLDHYGRKGMVDLCILSLDKRDVAFVLGIVEDGVYYEVTTAYDHQYKDYSPGTYLLQELFRELPASGVRRVVSHGDHEYKRRWATDYLPVYRVFIYSPGLKASIMHFVRFRLKGILNNHGTPISAGREQG